MAALRFDSVMKAHGFLSCKDWKCPRLMKRRRLPQFFWHTESVILRSQALMRLVGFNGRQVKEGTCNRSKQKASSGEKEPIPIRGPISCDVIKNTMALIVAPTLEKMFNTGISIIAAHKFFPPHPKKKSCFA